MGKAAAADVGQEMPRLRILSTMTAHCSFIDAQGPCFVGTCLLCQDVTKNGADFHSSSVSRRVRWFNNGTVTLIQEGSKRILQYDKYVGT